MSNIIGFVTARKTSRANLVAGWLDSGKIEVYDGTRPVTNGGAITTQNILVAFDIPSTSGTVTNGVFTGAEIEDAIAVYDGTGAWCRSYDSADSIIFDGDVGASGSGSFLELSSTSIVSGALVQVSSFSISEG